MGSDAETVQHNSQKEICFICEHSAKHHVKVEKLKDKKAPNTEGSFEDLLDDLEDDDDFKTH